MSASLKNFSGYVLAGGKSSRMGRDKALLETNGKTFLENSFEILNSICGDRIKVVLNQDQTGIVEKLHKNRQHIFDIYNGRGPLGGIHAALEDCKTRFAVIIACDMPLITAGIMRRLAEAALNSDCDAVVPKQNDDKLQPLCAIYRVSGCISSARKLIVENRNISVNNYISTLKLLCLDFGNEPSFFNANSPLDLIQMKSKKH